MILRLLAVLFMAAVVSGQEVLGNIDSDQLTEISGITRSRNDGLFWVHNDSGDGPVAYAIDRQARLRARIELEGVKARDWEDITSVQAADGSVELFLADMGDNKAVRDSIVIYRLLEPVIPEGPAIKMVDLLMQAEAIELVYPGGPRDAEALLVQPAQGDAPARLLIVSKRHSPNQVYACDLPELGSDAAAGSTVPVTLELLGPVRGIEDPNITGGDLSQDGKRLVLRTYLGAYEWDVPDGDVGAALTERDWSRQFLLPLQPQGEAITFEAGGEALITVSEGDHQPLYRIPNP